MTYFNVPKNNRRIFLVDHNFLGLGRFVSHIDIDPSIENNMFGTIAIVVIIIIIIIIIIIVIVMMMIIIILIMIIMTLYSPVIK